MGIRHLLARAVALSSLAVFLWGCGRANDAAPTIDKNGKHPTGWAIADTGGSHPDSFIASPAQCRECHGKDLTGGISKVSCFSTSFAGIACHPNGPSGHPVGWAAPDSHGAAAKAASVGVNGLAHCQRCHGADFAGGSVNVSCFTCHGVNAPHSAKPWRSSTRTHASTDPSNAAVCAQCHTAGANLSAVFRQASYATGTPGCFNNTLCHGQVGHPSGWASPSQHGASAKGTLDPNNPQNNLAYCQGCHGPDFRGSGAAVSCFSCHATAPHSPAPWRIAAGSLSTTRHTDTIVTNAVTCALCHLNNQRLTRPQALPAGANPGCFNNTLCHGATGHTNDPQPWRDPINHGARAKQAPGGAGGFTFCRNCHGDGSPQFPLFQGGVALTSCMNTLGCHGLTVSSPHPARPWRGSATTHTNTDTGNASICAICHTNGANSTRQPSPLDKVGNTSCFNATMCHGVTGHTDATVYPQPWSSPANHGRGAKGLLTNIDGFLYCQHCHGNDFRGGSALVSCVNNPVGNCHSVSKVVASPHPAAPWLSASVSHTTTGQKYANVCAQCHTAGANLSATFVAKYGPAYGGTGPQTCFNNTLCHPNLGDCTVCHSTQQGTGRRVVIGSGGVSGGDFALASHHIQGSPVNQKSCAVCHDQSNHRNVDPTAGVKVLLFNQDTGASILYDGTPANNAEIFCVSCHDSNGAANLGAQATTPFIDSGDATPPPNIGWTAGAQAHSANMACFSCHGNSAGVAGNTLNPTLNGHGSATAKLLHFPFNATDTNTNAANFCYNCHGTATAAAAGTSNIQSQFAKAVVHNGALCSDCHNVHQAKAGKHTIGSNLAGNALNGASAARLSNTGLGFFLVPSAADFTTTQITGGADPLAYVCFKCHSAFRAGGPPVIISGPFANAIQGTDVAREFNPNNVGNYGGSWVAGETAGGFHPVLATAGANLGAINLNNLVITNYAWSKTARNLMTCVDCHGSDAGNTDPVGPHGSAASFILKGPNTRWDSSLTLTPAGMPAGTFCANCHAANFGSSRFPAHLNDNHTVPCFTCHIAIPHGGQRPGFLHAHAGAAAGVPAAPVTDVAPYWQNAGFTLNLYIRSYPVNNVTNWDAINCGCNGTTPIGPHFNP
jgi:hypothetical protein